MERIMEKVLVTIAVPAAQLDAGTAMVTRTFSIIRSISLWKKFL